jgi:Zn finger protein HypA/HybF involved in hydrogenase expression
MKFEVYTSEGFIGYADSIKPFSVPGKQAMMLEGFVPVGYQVADKSYMCPPADAEAMVAPITPAPSNPAPNHTNDYQEREVIRDRLPNFDKRRDTITIIEGGKHKEVSLSEGTGIKEASYFRCPECGQSAIISVDGVIAVRVLDTDMEMVKTATGIDMNNYVYKNTEGDNSYTVVKLSADDNIEGFCPHCLNSSKLTEWFKAWEDPLSYSEFEHPCAMCGSETVAIFEDGIEYRQCEDKDCKFKQYIGRIER